MRSVTSRFGYLRVCVVLLSVVLSTFSFASSNAQAQTQPDWLDGINKLRSGSGLPTVTQNSATTTGAFNHSRYMVLNNTISHTEVSTNPGYTVDGAAAGQAGDLAVDCCGNSMPTSQDALRRWMTSGYHWEGILDSGLTSVGYGAANYQDAFPGKPTPTNFVFTSGQTLVFSRAFKLPAQPIMWPPNGGTMPYTSYDGGEAPDPISANCPGYSPTNTGASLSLQLPSAPQVTNVTLTQSGIAGALQSCWFDAATVKFTSNDQAAGWDGVGRSILTSSNAVVIFPRQPLSNGTYCVSVTNAGSPIQWTFTVGASPTSAPAPCGPSAPLTPAPTPIPPAPTPTPNPPAQTGPWLISTSQQIAHYDMSASSAQNVAGAAVRVAVGPDGQPWVVNSSGNIYRRVKGATGYVDGTWQRVPGTASAIAVGGDGTVWTIGAATISSSGKAIQYFDPLSSTWIAVSGSGVEIGVGPDGQPWVVNAANHIYRRVKGPTGYADGGWQQLSGAATAIAVGGDGSAWITGPDQSIQRYNASAGAWETQSGLGVRIGVDAQGTPWVVNVGGTLWHLQGSVWSSFGDGYADVGVH